MHLPQQLDHRLKPLLDELEEGCAQAEAALRACKLDVALQAIYNQRRVRQAIVNELAAANHTVAEIPEVETRLRAVLRFRESQLRRLVAYREHVSKSLQNTRKWRDVARAASRRMGPTPVLISTVQ